MVGKRGRKEPSQETKGEWIVSLFHQRYVCGVWSLAFLLPPHFHFFKYNFSFVRAEVMNETKKSASHRDDLMAEIAGQSFVQKDGSLLSPYFPRVKGTQGSRPSLTETWKKSDPTQQRTRSLWKHWGPAFVHHLSESHVYFVNLVDESGLPESWLRVLFLSRPL